MIIRTCRSIFAGGRPHPGRERPGSLGGRCTRSGIRVKSVASLLGSFVNIGTVQRRLAWPLRKDDTHKPRSVYQMCAHTCRPGPRWCPAAARSLVLGDESIARAGAPESPPERRRGSGSHAAAETPLRPLI